MTNNKYREYFDIDPMYFPQINDSSIAEAPDCWKKTYPHPTFIAMLRDFERCLARQERRSLWIQGSYGVGKSQCAYTLKKLLEVPEDELRAYWSTKALEHQTDLLEKLVGHRKKGDGIVVIYRYATTDVASPRHFYLEVQKSVRDALRKKGLYEGENTLKESVIAWIEKPANKNWFNELLAQPHYKAMFTQNDADGILASLRNNSVVTELMGNIFNLADKEGVTALNIGVDKLIMWLTDVIDHNNIKIVFVWDQFGDYFDRSGGEKVDAFQKLCELVNHKTFYFVPVTHYSSDSYIKDKDAWKSVSDRFIASTISLPDNIAIQLIGHAFNVKPAAKDWILLTDDLNERIKDARAAVIKTAKITDPQEIKNIIPLHPMAALLLQNIASAFKSNQRSMFDFIKSSNTDDVKAFQWFIENTGPFDEHPLLTVDMLWNFFYEKGRDNLTPDIRLILDTFPQQQNLRDDEKAVLKAILIMQAIDQRLGGTIELFKATEQNLSYVFEGIPDLEGTKSGNIAKSLKNKGILVSNPISGGRYIYAAAVLAGDQAKIDSNKNKIRQNSTTSKLVTEGGLSTVLSLPPALRLRFEAEPGTGKITPVTATDFTRTINILRDRTAGWNFHAVIAFAKDESEAAMFRKTIKAAVADKQYENIVFIDALSTTLGSEAFEQYVDFSAMSMYYQGSNNTSSQESSDKAKRILEQDWKNRVYSGQFAVYTYTNQEGDKLGNGQGVVSVLQTIVTAKFPYMSEFDFAKNLTESQLKLTQAKDSAKSGIIQTTKGAVAGIEKRVLSSVWAIDKYWENPTTTSLPIAKIKVEVDKRIETAFARVGQISIGEIYNLLEEKYGFAPCNLSAFIAGFLLKEYGSEPYRYSDSSSGHGQMTQDKLAEMLGNYIGKSPKSTYIVKMTADEMAFYELTEQVWRIPSNSCSSAGQAAISVMAKMRGFGLPVWCLEEVDDAGVFDLVRKYIELVQKEGDEAHKKAIEIGKIASAKPSIINNLSSLLTSDNCQKGMREYLCQFEGGKIMELATAIGADNNVLTDIRRLFGVKHSCLWDKQIGEDEIRKLLTEYGIVKEINATLNTSAHSLAGAFREWRERLKFIGISCEALQAKYPSLAKALNTLMRIYKQEDILPEQLKAFHPEMITHGAQLRELLNNDRRVFAEIYEPYLEDLSDNDIAELKSKLQTGLFELPKTDCNAKVKESAEEYRKNQLKSQLFRLWKDKTGTKNPREWSSRYRMPVLCCVSEVEYEKAKKVFETLNRNGGTDAEIRYALAFLESTTIFDVLADDEQRNTAFKRDIVGEYSALLPDLDKVRDTLDRLSVDTYDWRDNPSVKGKIKQLAEAEYNAGGSDKVLLKIDEMNDAQLKQYLKRLVKDNITVGIEILTN